MVVDFFDFFLMCCSQFQHAISHLDMIHFRLEISVFFLLFFQNKSEGATEKFQEIQGAYKYLREGELAFLNIYLQDYSIFCFACTN